MSFEIPPTMAGHVAGFLKQVSSKLSATGGNEMDKLLEIVALDDDRMAPVARGLAWSCMQQPTHYQYILARPEALDQMLKILKGTDENGKLCALSCIANAPKDLPTRHALGSAASPLRSCIMASDCLQKTVINAILELLKDPACGVGPGEMGARAIAMLCTEGATENQKLCFTLRAFEVLGGVLHRLMPYSKAGTDAVEGEPTAAVKQQTMTLFALIQLLAQNAEGVHEALQASAGGTSTPVASVILEHLSIPVRNVQEYAQSCVFWFSTSEEGRKAVVDHALPEKERRGVSLLLSLLASPKQSIAQRSYKVLSNLCVDEYGRCGVTANPQNIETFARGVVSSAASDRPTTLTALTLLNNMLTSEEDFEAVANLQNPLVPDLIRIPVPKSKDGTEANIEYQVWHLLGNLLVNDTLQTHFIANDDGPKALAHVLGLGGGGMPETKREAARAISNMCRLFDENRQVLYDAGVIQPLVLLAGYEPMPELQAAALRALVNVSLCYERSIEIVAVARSVSLFVKYALSSEDSERQRNALQLLVNLSASDVSGKKLVSACGGLVRFSHLLSASNPDTVYQGLKLFTNFSRHGVNRKWMHENGQKAVLERMLTSKSEPFVKAQAELVLINMSFPYDDSYTECAVDEHGDVIVPDYVEEEFEDVGSVSSGADDEKIQELEQEAEETARAAEEARVALQKEEEEEARAKKLVEEARKKREEEEALVRKQQEAERAAQEEAKRKREEEQRLLKERQEKERALEQERMEREQREIEEERLRLEQQRKELEEQMKKEAEASETQEQLKKLSELKERRAAVQAMLDEEVQGFQEEAIPEKEQLVALEKERSDAEASLAQAEGDAERLRAKEEEAKRKLEAEKKKQKKEQRKSKKADKAGPSWTAALPDPAKYDERIKKYKKRSKRYSKKAGVSTSMVDQAREALQSAVAALESKGPELRKIVSERAALHEQKVSELKGQLEQFEESISLAEGGDGVTVVPSVKEIQNKMRKLEEEFDRKKAEQEELVRKQEEERKMAQEKREKEMEDARRRAEEEEKAKANAAASARHQEKLRQLMEEEKTQKDRQMKLAQSRELKRSLLQQAMEKESNHRKLIEEQRKSIHSQLALQTRDESDAAVRAKMIARRTNIGREMYDTEKSYVDSLRILLYKLVQFMKPLDASARNGRELISIGDVRKVFSNVEMITNVNSILLEGLESRLSRWTDLSCVGDIFINLTAFLKCYVEYVNNYNQAVEVLAQLKSTNKKFANYIARLERSKECKGLQLDSFLIMPVQRVPRYVMLLSDMVKNTWEEHPDHANLSKALQLMKETGDFINEKKRHAENLQKMFEVETQLTGDFGGTLIAPARQFLRSGEVNVIIGGPSKTVSRKPKPKQGMYFLFNDLFVCAVRQSGNLKFMCRLDLKTLDVHETNEYAAGPALSIHGIPDIAEYKKGKELKKRAFDVVMRCKTPKEQLVLAEQIEKEQEALMARRNSFFSASLDR